MQLRGAVALVTGASRGVGRAIAIALAEAGAAVVVNDVADPEPVVGEIRSRGGRAEGIVGSVADGGDVRRIVDTAVSAFGRLDVLVNNAGIVRSRPIVEMTDEDFDAVVAVHLRGTFLCTREALRVMRTAGQGGRIINVTSGAAF
ncbi:MAG TPA: SDR family NAD(P)-dependent oxidoreductase, partial [Candidatus Binatia bacterium]|nr:SDR family NAD(P)-dependent oxidoreductase [Candidatus Binatia bacterium]